MNLAPIATIDDEEKFQSNVSPGFPFALKPGSFTMPLDRQPTAVGVKRRACVNCTAGKAKCSPLTQDECERCNRLGKECIYLNAVHKRKSPKSSSRVQLLESKVDGLLSLLSKQFRESDAGTEVSSVVSKPGNQKTSGERQSDEASTTGTSLSGNATPQQSSVRTGGTTVVETEDIIDRGLVTIETAQKLLDKFRLDAVHHFPFVVIPPDTSLTSVRHSTPFLFLCIITAMMTHDCSLQRQLGEEIRTQAHRRMLLGFEISLELLQGLLVHLAWYHFHFLLHRQQVFLICQLCITLVHEMGLDRNPADRKRKTDLELDHLGLCGTSSRSAAGVRALLGTYCMASVIATKVRKRCAMPYSKYIKLSSLLLAETKEYPTDELILPFVRNQELVQRIHGTFSLEDLDDIKVRSESIINITVQSFQHELDSLENSVPVHLKENLTLVLEFHQIGLFIEEVALHEEFWESSAVSASSTPTIPSPPSSLRCNLIWASIQRCKSVLEMVNAYPNQETFQLTYYTFSTFCYLSIWLVKLSYIGTHTRSGDETTNRADRANEASPVLSSILFEAEAQLPPAFKQLHEKLYCMGQEISANDEGELDTMRIFSLMLRAVMSEYGKRMKHIRLLMTGHLTTESIGESSLPVDQRLEPANSSSFSDPSDPNASGEMLLPDEFPYSSNFQLDAFQDMVWDRIFDDFAWPS